MPEAEVTTATGWEFNCFEPVRSARYANELQRVVTFMRRAASGRYSDRTWGMFARRCDQATDMAEHPDRGRFYDDDYGMPWAYTLERSPGYDEVTEVKVGGIYAAALVTPPVGDENDDCGRIYMATHEPYRRQGLATALFVRAVGWHVPSNCSTYVARTNRPGIVTAVALGFNPAEVRGSVIRFEWNRMDYRGLRRGDPLPF